MRTGLAMQISRFTAIFVGVITLALMAGAVAEAVIPTPERTLQAIAGVNRASGRTQALQLDMTLRVGDAPPIASGELISHPSGLARLEIRGYDGRVDRYLLSGDELTGTMNGRPLTRPGPLLQPIFLLQPGSGSTLRTALEVFGVRTSSIGLAPCGEADCFVIGDPRLEAPLPPKFFSPVDPELEDLGLDTTESGANYASPESGPELVGPIMQGGRLARIWVDTEDLQVQRIDRADGVVVIFGPIINFERVKVPSWIEIRDPSEPFPMRFAVDRAVQMNAPPGAFDRSWLTPPMPIPDDAPR